MNNIIITKDKFKWLNVTKQSNLFLQFELNKGNLYILHDDESETNLQELADLTEAIKNKKTLVIEFKYQIL